MTLRSYIGLTTLTCLLAACSNLADEHTSAPPLATIGGTLTLADGAEIPDGQLRLALLWATNEPYGSGATETGNCQSPFAKTVTHAEQQIDIDATFPNQFELELTTPPPGNGLIPSEENGDPDHGEAHLVAYADVNGNGQLDTRPDDAPSPDLLLGTTEPSRYAGVVPGATHQIEFLYWNEPYTLGEPGTPTFLEYPAGYSMFRYAYGDDHEIHSAVEPIETPIDMRLDPTAELQMSLCEYLCSDQMPFTCPASPADLPAPPAHAREFVVSSLLHPAWTWTDGGDDHSFQWTACSTIPTPTFNWAFDRCEGCSCASTSCLYTQDMVPAEDWPCDP